MVILDLYIYFRYVKMKNIASKSNYVVIFILYQPFDFRNPAYFLSLHPGVPVLALKFFIAVLIASLSKSSIENRWDHYQSLHNFGEKTED